MSTDFNSQIYKPTMRQQNYYEHNFMNLDPKTLKIKSEQQIVYIGFISYLIVLFFGI